jgi:hypothetical protein
MDDLLERTLTATLREIGESVPDEIEPPADLELRVARQRRSRTTARSAFLLAMAAALVVAVGAVAVVRVTSPSSSPATRPPVDPLPVGTAVLEARGRDIVALDARDQQLATMVHVRRGSIVDVQLTSDHRYLWYLSVAGRGGIDCGDVVRADLLMASSRVVAHAVAFAISLDGARLALYGSGRVAQGLCGTRPNQALAIAIVNEQTGARAQTRASAGTRELRWARNGTALLEQSCVAGLCHDVVRALNGDVSLGAVVAGPAVADSSPARPVGRSTFVVNVPPWRLVAS